MVTQQVEDQQQFESKLITLCVFFNFKRTVCKNTKAWGIQLTTCISVYNELDPILFGYLHPVFKCSVYRKYNKGTPVSFAVV